MTPERYALSLRIRHVTQEMQLTKRYLTPSEVADELSISTSTVRRLIHEGRLPAVRVSERIYRVPVPAFERFQSGAAAPQVRVRERRGGGGSPIGAGERVPVRRRLPASA